MVVLNPHGGTRRSGAILDEVRPVFEDAGAELVVHRTTHARHATELAGSLDLSDCAGLCVIGGDGTLSETVDGLMTRAEPDGVPLGVIPGGTGNDFLRHFECTDPMTAARRIVAGKTIPLDVARVTMGETLDYCVNLVGWGAVVDANRRAERLRRLGTSRYKLAALQYILFGRAEGARITMDDEVIDDKLVLAAVCNTRYTGRGMLMAPKADAGDGKLDVLLLRRTSRLKMLQFFRAMYHGAHVGLPGVEYRQARSVTIEPEEDDELNMDGEIMGTTPATIDVLPGALQIFG
jgi:diacylglycerol kinase (ATP)